MNVVIRTDASLEIGTGHVMRCLTLARQLSKEGAKVIFICRDFPGNCISYIKSEGFQVNILSSNILHYHWKWIRQNWKQDANETKQTIYTINGNVNLLIVDHYALDAQWESEFRSTVKCIMVIDDLADRLHNCDLILDQNYYLDMKKRYDRLVPNSCIKLLGPSYVLLREEFLSIDTTKIKRDGHIRNILVFFGGADHTGETMKTLHAIQEIKRTDINFNIIVGSVNPYKHQIEQLCKKMPNVTFLCQVKNMAELMIKADLSIGAGGATTWERCYLQLPSISLILAENQRVITRTIEKIGGTICLGESNEVNSEIIKKEILRLCSMPNELKKMQRQCLTIMDSKLVREKGTIRKLLKILQS